MRHAILLAAFGLLALVDGSAIKGQPRTPERLPKSAPATPILESSKRIYNDESIRRLVAQQASPEEPAKPAAVQAKAASVDPAKVVKADELPAPSDRSFPVREDQPVVAAKPVAETAAVAVAAQPAPIQEVPAQAAPVQAAPVQVAPVQVAPVHAAPVHTVPVPVVPVQAAPAQAAPVLAAQAEPVQAAPVQAAPVQIAPVQVVPAAVAPAHVAQVQPVESELQAKKDEPEQPIEVPAPDPGLVLSEPIDSTTKLLIDLDEHVQKFLPTEEQAQPAPSKEQALVAGVDYAPTPVEPSGKSAPLVPYSSSGADEAIVPPLPSLEGVEKAAASAQTGAQPVAPTVANSVSSTRQAGQNQNQQQMFASVLAQLDTLQDRITDTMNQLVARRRYVMSALLRPMGTYVRRVRTNLERLQNRVNQVQAAASSVGGGANRPGGFVDQAAIEAINKRIQDISKRISGIVNQIRVSMTPTSAPLNPNGK